MQVRTAALLAAAALLLPTATAGAANPTNTSALVDAVDVTAIREHQRELQGIAEDGNRAAGTPGHEASADYVESQLEAAGYDVTRQEFSYQQFREQSPPEFEQVTPTPTVYTESTAPSDGNDFATLTYSGSGDVTARVTGVDLALAAPTTSTSGCEAADFAGFPAGHIALIQRGTCSFAQKAANADAAGAAAVIIFNQGDADTAERRDVFYGTLGEAGAVSDDLPVIGTSFAVGEDLSTGATARVAVHAFLDLVDTVNVIAETPSGRNDRVVLVGAHLDSVQEGPGINDNGSGSAAILEIALQLAELDIAPRNAVRFAWWSGEEDGLVGSQHYVDSLSRKAQKRIMLNLNFDMLGSPNFIRFVYDGDGSDTGTAGPNGSGRIEEVFTDWFDARGLPYEATAFDGRSDYGPFIDVGIPAGGLFSGAEDEKTADQAAVYGGTAGVAYDPCYHAACDDFAGTSGPLAVQGLDTMADAAAHTVLTFAQTTSAVNGTAQGQGHAAREMRGHRNLR